MPWKTRHSHKWVEEVRVQQEASGNTTTRDIDTGEVVDYQDWEATEVDDYDEDEELE